MSVPPEAPAALASPLRKIQITRLHAGQTDHHTRGNLELKLVRFVAALIDGRMEYSMVVRGGEAIVEVKDNEGTKGLLYGATASDGEVRVCVASFLPFRYFNMACQAR
jgi:hypothetical protein